MTQPPFIPGGGPMNPYPANAPDWRKELGIEDVRPGAGEDGELSERERERKIIEECQDRAAIGASAIKEQLDREQRDEYFDGVSQWREDVRRRRTTAQAPDGRSTPELPCLEIDQIDQPLQQVIAEARRSRVTIDVKPRGEHSNQDMADALQGLLRKIERDSNALDARIWALERAAKVGRGFYRLRTQFVSDPMLEARILSGDEVGNNPQLFDQEICVERIQDQGSVICDPFAQKKDGSDAEWVMFPTRIHEDEYKRRYGETALAEASDIQIDALKERAPEWVEMGGTSGKRVFRVAEYYYVVWEKRRVIGHEDLGQAYVESEAPEAVRALKGSAGFLERDMHIRTVKWCRLNGEEIIEGPHPWPSRYLPIVPVFGKEYFADQRKIYKGIIAKSRDAQEMFNAVMSRLTEQIWFASIAPYVVAEGQVGKFKSMWQTANSHYWPYLIYQLVHDEQGRLAPPPQRQFQEPAIQSTMQAAQQIAYYIRTVTGRYGPSLGEPIDPDQSGVAVAELKMQAQAGTSTYFDSLTDTAIPLEGRITLDLARTIYARPGREVKIVGAEGKERSVLLNMPFTVDSEDRPQPLDEEQYQQLKESGEAEVQFIDVVNGTFDVEIGVGKGFDTLREEALNVMSEAGKIWPEGFQIWADLFFRSQDFRLKDEIADRIERQNPHAQDPEGLKKLPPAAQAEIQRLDDSLREAMATIDEMEKTIDTQRTKAEYQLEIERVKADMRVRVEVMKQAFERAMATTKNESETARSEMDALAERALAELDHLHEREMQDDQQKHEKELTRIKAKDEDKKEPDDAGKS